MYCSGNKTNTTHYNACLHTYVGRSIRATHHVFSAMYIPAAASLFFPIPLTDVFSNYIDQSRVWNSHDEICCEPYHHGIAVIRSRVSLPSHVYPFPGCSQARCAVTLGGDILSTLLLMEQPPIASVHHDISCDGKHVGAGFRLFFNRDAGF